MCEANITPAKMDTMCVDTETESYDPANWPDLLDYKVC